VDELAAINRLKQALASASCVCKLCDGTTDCAAGGIAGGSAYNLGQSQNMPSSISHSLSHGTPTHHPAHTSQYEYLKHLLEAAVPESSMPGEGDSPEPMPPFSQEVPMAALLCLSTLLFDDDTSTQTHTAEVDAAVEHYAPQLENVDEFTSAKLDGIILSTADRYMLQEVFERDPVVVTRQVAK
jgi:hypothetical protein